MKNSYGKILVGVILAIGGIISKNDVSAGVGISLAMNGILEVIEL